MPDFEALIVSVNQNIGKLEEELGGTQDQLESVNAKLDRLPKEYIPRTEAEIKATRVKRALAGIVAGIVVIVSLFGTVLYLNHSVTCGVRGILVSAQHSATRNPLPDTLSDQERERIEAQRDQAKQFYAESLERLNIIWPCAGETP